jgi:hypothetical protein
MRRRHHDLLAPQRYNFQHQVLEFLLFQLSCNHFRRRRIQLLSR